jgi:ABC-type transport system involved in cytochrome bd biosynthesis fused ATPase/permease subunit
MKDVSIKKDGNLKLVIINRGAYVDYFINLENNQIYVSNKPKIYVKKPKRDFVIKALPYLGGLGSSFLIVLAKQAYGYSSLKLNLEIMVMVFIITIILSLYSYKSGKKNVEKQDNNRQYELAILSQDEKIKILKDVQKISKIYYRVLIFLLLLSIGLMISFILVFSLPIFMILLSVLAIFLMILSVASPMKKKKKKSNQVINSLSKT